MPELPEVESVCRGLKPLAVNKKITKAVVRQYKLREQIPDNINELVSGRKIVNIFRRAKYILIELDNKSYLIIHLGMSGTFTYQKPISEVTKHSHIDFILDNSDILRYTDPRKFGMVLWEKDYLNNKYIQRCGLEPLTEEFMNDFLYEQTRNKKTPIKPFLMKNEIVVGVGNIYASESLFKAKLSPLKKACDLTKEECLNLSKEIQKILLFSIENGGTTLKDHRTGLNEKGKFQNNLSVYGQDNCQVCDNKIEKITQSQRTTYYCPKCQKI